LATRFVRPLNDNYEGDMRSHSLPEDYFHDWHGHFDLASFRDAATRRLDRDKGFYEWDFTNVCEANSPHRDGSPLYEATIA
jgi:hypothetical protein